MEDRAWSWHDLVGREGVDGDVVVVQLGGEVGGEPLDGCLAHAVDGAAAGGPGVGKGLGVHGGDGGDVEYPAGAAGPHSGQDQGRQVEWRLHLDVEHQRVLLGREVLDPAEVGHGGIADQDVGRAELADGLFDQETP